ncbi:MAG: AMP-binding protein, partial [bacterium]|nr:AMP-binding protein [bacterium]
EGVTLYMALLAVFNVFLHKLSGREDIVVGSPEEGRGHEDFTRIIGMFVNTLALRNKPSGNKTFNGFLQEIKENTLAAFEHRDYPFEDLVELLDVPRDLARNPLFDVMFVLQNNPSREIKIPGLTLGNYSFEHRTAKFDLSLTAVELQERLYLSFEYVTALFEAETIQRFIRYFRKIVGTVLTEPAKRIAAIEIMADEEKRRILHGFNDTAADYPQNKTIHQLFEEQAARTPDAIAIIEYRSYKTYMTYAQLNRSADRAASFLLERGVAPGDITALKMDRSLERMVGIFGILKAGAAYLPIDPQYPQERIDFMLADSNAKIMLDLTHPTPNGAPLSRGDLDWESARASFKSPLERALEGPRRGTPKGGGGVNCLRHLHLRYHRPSQGSHDRSSFVGEPVKLDAEEVSAG